MDRSGCPVLLVDLNGRLGVRKEFRNRGRFVQELEALLHLKSSACPVPQLMNVDWQKGSITITFVPGDVVRELLAEAGADIRDRDIDGSYTREVDRQRIRSGRELVPSVLSSRHIEGVAAALNSIHAAGIRSRGPEVRKHHPQGTNRRTHLRRPGARASRRVAAATACQSPAPDRLAQVSRPFRRRALRMNALRHSFASSARPQSGKRRVLFVINSLAGGGAERVMATLLDNSKEWLSQYDIALALLDDGPRAFELPGWLRIIQLDCKGGMRSSLSALDAIVGDYRPDATVSFLTRANLVSGIAMMKRGKPWIISERTSTPAHLGGRARQLATKMMMRAIYPRATRVIAVSGGVANKLERSARVRARRIDVIPNPVDLGALEAASRQDSEFGLDVPYIVAVGRLVSVKNYRMLIEAFAKSNLPCRLVIAGDGPERAALETFASQLGIADRVVMPGWLPNPYPALARASLFALSSNVEGFPNALVEALALGASPSWRPTVTTARRRDSRGEQRGGGDGHNRHRCRHACARRRPGQLCASDAARLRRAHVARQWSRGAASAPAIIRRRRSPRATGTLSSGCWKRRSREWPAERSLARCPRGQRACDLCLARFGDRVARQQAVQHIPLDLPVRHRRKIEDQEAQMASEQQVARTFVGGPGKPEHRSPQHEDRRHAGRFPARKGMRSACCGRSWASCLPTKIRPEPDQLLHRRRIGIGIDIIAPDIRPRGKLLALFQVKVSGGLIRLVPCEMAERSEKRSAWSVAPTPKSISPETTISRRASDRWLGSNARGSAVNSATIAIGRMPSIVVR